MTRNLLSFACLFLFGSIASAQSSPDDSGMVEPLEDTHGYRSNDVNFSKLTTRVSKTPGLAGGDSLWSGIGPEGGTIRDVVFSPVDPDLAFAAHARTSSDFGRLFRSTDGGETWGAIPGLERKMYEIEFANDGTAYASGTAGIWKSTDDGETWTVFDLGIENRDAVVDFKLDPSDPDGIWACIQPLDGTTSITRSVDGGVTWEDRTPSGAEGDRCSGITIDPTNSNTVIAAFWEGTRLWATTDGGDTWEDRSAGLPGDRPMNTAFYDGTRLLVGGGQLFGSQNVGLYSSNDLGASWTPLHDATWENLVVEIIMVDPDDEDVIHAGTRNGGLYRTTDGGATWDIAIGESDDLHINSVEFGPNGADLWIGTNSLGAFVSGGGNTPFELASDGISQVELASIHANPLDPDEIAVSFVGVNDGGVYTTINGGATWTLEVAPPVRWRVTRFSPDGILYAVSGGPTAEYDEALYRRETDGTWTHLGPSQQTSFDNDVFALRFSQTDPNLVLQGGRDRGSAEGNEMTIWLSDDGGETWTKVHEGTDFDHVVDIEIVEDGLDDVMVAAFTRPFTGDTRGGILRSGDGGMTWDRPGSEFPSVVLDGRLCSRVDTTDAFYFSATLESGEGGLFQSNDAGETWTAMAWTGATGIADIACDRVNGDVLYVTQNLSGSQVMRSEDGGLSFEPFAVGLGSVVDPTEFAFAGPGELLLATGEGSFVRPLSVNEMEPIADISPGSFTFEVEEGDSETQILSVGNTGEAPLDWSIVEAENALGGGMVWSDNFDSYDAGSQMHGQGGWKGWDNAPAAGALVSDAQANSSPHSVDINGGTDLVHEFTQSSGQWVFTTWQYIPGDFSGQTYFILLSDYIDGGPYSWTAQVNFDSANGMVSNDGLSGGTLPMITDQWVEIRVEFDLDNDTQTFYYDGEELYSGTWTGEQQGGGSLNFGAVDLYANSASEVYYDDLSLAEFIPSACDSPSDVAWLSLSADSGTTTPGGSETVDVTVDASTVAPGADYAATLCVTTNDPSASLVEIPVAMNVAPTIATEATPDELADILGMPSPNPVRGAATFAVAVEDGQNVTVEVFDVTGRRVQTLYDGALASGMSETLTLDASALPAGVYVIRATGEDFSKTRHVTVVR